MPAKKKPTKKAQKTTAFDAALELPAAKATIPVATVEVRLPPEQAQILADEIGNQIMEQIEGGEPWPNYSPFPEEENEGPGFSPANIQPATEDTNAVEAAWDDVIATGPNEPVPMDESVLGSGEPVSASEPLSGTNIPADAAKTVTDLIDAANYLFAMCRTIRGPRGLKMHDEPILKRRVAAGRQLVSLLAELKP